MENIRTPYDEQVKNKIRQAFYVVFLLLIFEGVLRKWLLPQFSSALFFIKEPFIIYIYYLSLRHRLTPKSAFFNLVILLSVFFLLLVAIQSFIYQFDLFIGFYGWRNYCLYAPLPFIVASILREEDVVKIAKTTCFIAVGMAILGYIQYSSPVDSFINRNVGFSDAEVFTVGGGVVRPYGTFSFTTGFSTFISLHLAFLLYNFFQGKNAFLKPLFFYISLFSFFTCLAVSGSRGAYFSVGLILLFVAFSSILVIRKKQGTIIIMSLIIGSFLAVLLFTLFFSDQWELMVTRQTHAEAVEGSIFDRAFSLLLGINFFLQTDLSLLGLGLGQASVGGGYLSTGTAGFAVVETEWARHLFEAGLIMGLIYIVFRIAVVIDILKDAVFSLLKTSNPAPLAFVGFMLPNILVGSITGNGIAYSFTWICLGISLAMNRIYNKRAI